MLIIGKGLTKVVAGLKMQREMWIKVRQHWVSWLAALAKSLSTSPFLWHLGESN